MNGNLFPVKARAFAAALAPLKRAIVKSNAKCNALEIKANDGMIRMVLSSTEVLQEVRKQFALDHSRVRFAIPEALTSSARLSMPALEVYTVEGNLFCDPIPAPELDIALSNAVQVELMHFLLKQKGVKIPLL